MANLRDQAAAALAKRIQKLLGSEGTFTVEVGYAYVQASDASSDDGPGFWVELVSNQFLTEPHRLSARAEQQLRDLGFSDPDGDELPNWWFGGGSGADEDDDEDSSFSPAEMLDFINQVSHAAVDALVDTYHLSERAVALAMGVRAEVPAPPTFEPELAEDDLVVDVEALRKAYLQFARLRRVAPYTTPSDSDVPACYFSIVSDTDRSTVFDLVALAPASSSDPMPGWWLFTRGGWLPDPFAVDGLSDERRLRAIDEKTARYLESAMEF